MGTRQERKNFPFPLQDHPHACGDKTVISVANASLPGSSPRVWGQVLRNDRKLIKDRIIPTRVGTRNNKNCPRRNFWDHPHACGDKAKRNSLNLTSLGSSPRVWGQEHYETVFNRNLGIIPTRVGTRLLFLLQTQACQDHPHACGDKLQQS